jgi:flagellar hook protein FlgE
MSFNFQQAISGLDASSQSLDVIGNNIANSGTTGYKRARVSFGDVYANSVSSAGNNPVGIGVQVQAINRLFTQGGLTTTNNPLDLGISGDGFFAVKDPISGARAYTRAGQMNVDSNGYLVTAGKQRVLDSSGSPLVVKIDGIDPVATSKVSTRFNFDSRAPLISGSIAFDPANADTYNYSNGLRVYDGLGGQHALNLYFRHTAARQWVVLTTLDGTTRPTGDPTAVTAATTAVGTAQTAYNAAVQAYQTALAASPQVPATIASTATTLNTAADALSAAQSALDTANGYTTINFDGEGSGLPYRVDTTGKKLPVSTPPLINLSFALPNNPNPGGATSTPLSPLKMSLSLADSTQYAAAFEAQALNQDGQTSGSLTGFSIDNTGQLISQYSNGRTAASGRMALANFRTPEGLRSISGNLYVETIESGVAQLSNPDSTTANGRLGSLKPGSLEDSNVNLTQELVDLIRAQRTYQANAKTIQIQNEAAQAILSAV